MKNIFNEETVKFYKYENLKFEYFYKDNKKDKTLFFIHGFSSNFAFFEQIYKEFDDEYNLLGLNMPAHGNSQFIPTMMNMVDFRDLIVNFINDMKLKNLYIIGHSMGGGLAMMIYKFLENKIAKIALVGPMSRSGRVKISEFEECFFPRNIEDYKKLVKLCYHYPEKILNNKEIIERVALYLENNKKQLDYIYDLGHKLPELTNMDLIDYGIITCQKPLALIYGESDGIVDVPNIYKYYSSLNSKVINIKILNSGHSIWLENKIDFLTQLKEFLQK